VLRISKQQNDKRDVQILNMEDIQVEKRPALNVQNISDKPNLVYFQSENIQVKLR
jgi:hypothetical protein